MPVCSIIKKFIISHKERSNSNSFEAMHARGDPAVPRQHTYPTSWLLHGRSRCSHRPHRALLHADLDVWHIRTPAVGMTSDGNK